MSELGDDCDQIENMKNKLWLYEKWKFCGTRERVKRMDKLNERKQERIEVGLPIYDSNTLKRDLRDSEKFDYKISIGKGIKRK